MNAPYVSRFACSLPSRGSRWALTLAVVAAMTASVAPAHAVDVYLNGAKVDGALRDQTFKGAEVRFDAKGDVHITIKGVKVHVVEQRADGQGSAVQQRPALTQRYWMVFQTNKPGKVQYTFEVHINGKLAVRADGKRRQMVEDVSKLLMPGTNTVVVTAIKDLSGGRQSLSPDDTFSLLLGEGSGAGDQLTIDKTLFRYERFASQVDNHTQTFTVKAR